MTKIKELMHSGVETHSPNAPISDVAKTMKEKDVGAVPIVDKGQLVGMVTDRDIAVRALADGKDAAKLSAKDVMTKNVASCQESDTAQAAARLMQTRQIRRLPVLNAEKRVIGMVSLGDLAHTVSNELRKAHQGRIGTPPLTHNSGPGRASADAPAPPRGLPERPNKAASTGTQDRQIGPPPHGLNKPHQPPSFPQWLRRRCGPSSAVTNVRVAPPRAHSRKRDRP